MSETTLLKALLHRRVPQILGLYLGGAWIAVEFSDLLVDRYDLSQTLVDFLLVLLASFVPTVLMLAWFHGAPGRDEWTRVEKIGIPVNVAVSVLILMSLFQGEELGATTTTVTVTDEEGQQIERTLAKRELRKRIAVFFFDNRTGDAELDWLQYGLTVAIAADLGQSMFVHAWTPYREYEARGFYEFRKAGFSDGLDVPLPLMKAVAQKKRRDYFITGAFDTSDEGYALQLDVYRTENTELVFSERVTGPDVLLLADRLSADFKDKIDLPDDDTGNRMSIADRAAGPRGALKYAVLGMNAEHLDNDLETAAAYWRQSVELDPSFAMVHMMMARAILQLGDLPGASEAIRNALRHDYQLTEDNRFIAKAVNYQLRGEQDKTVKLCEMWVELYPENTLARKILANVYIEYARRPRDALTQLQVAYELDPGDDAILLQIARLHELLGELDEAIEAYDSYAEKVPGDQTALVDMAVTLTNDGQLQAAADNFERASVLAPELVRPVVGLADIAIREGRYQDARAYLTDAEAIARIPQQQARVIRGWISYYQARGKVARIPDLIDQLYEVESAYAQPINLVMQTHVHYAGAYAQSGQTERGLDVMSRLKANFEPPLDGLVDVGFLIIWLEAGDAEKGREYLDPVANLINMLKQERHYYTIDMARARIAELEGDLEQAIAYDREALEQFSRSAASIEDETDRMVINLSLANYMIRTDKLDEAQEILSGYMRSFPAHPVANLELARLERARGSIEKAWQALQITLDAYTDADEEYRYAMRARALARELQQTG